MLIILLRHGVAEEKGSKPDRERRLTGDGNREMKKTAKGLAKRFPDADAIYSSPLVRAYETAEWVAKAYGGTLDIDTTAALEPGTAPEELRALLGRSDAECAYFVGHEPHLTTVMLDLTGMQASGKLALKKGGCYGVEWSGKDEPARLRWMLAPDLVD